MPHVHLTASVTVTSIIIRISQNKHRLWKKSRLTSTCEKLLNAFVLYRALSVCLLSHPPTSTLPTPPTLHSPHCRLIDLIDQPDPISHFSLSHTNLSCALNHLLESSCNENFLAHYYERKERSMPIPYYHH